MSRSKKRTVSQKIVGLGVSGMPAPVQKLVSGRIVAGLIVLLVPLLLATGIVTVTWEDGRPRFSINQEKAEIAKEKAAEEIQKLRAENNGSSLNPAEAIHALTGQQNSSSGFASEWGQSPGTVSKLAERVENMATGESKEPSKSWSLFPHGDQNSPPAADNSGPLSSLRQHFDSRR